MAPSETQSRVIIVTTSGARDATISAVALTMKPIMAAGTRAFQTDPVARCTRSAIQPAMNTITNSATQGSDA